MGYKAIRPTMVELATTIHRWERFEGLAGVCGEVGQALDGGRVWITRVWNSERDSGYAFTLFNDAAWPALRTAIRMTGEVPAHA
jgi:hypothetical protein